MTHAHSLSRGPRPNPHERMTRAEYLRRKILLDDAWDCPKAVVDETVAHLFRSHPEWDPKQVRSWSQWEGSGVASGR